MQHTATHCNALQRTATISCNTLHRKLQNSTLRQRSRGITAVDYNVNDTLQHTATYYNILQHTTTHTATQFREIAVPAQNEPDTLQHAARYCNTLWWNWQTTTHCNTMQYTATHCNTHYNTLQRRSRGITAPDSNLDEYAIQSRQVISSPPPLHGATESHKGCVYTATNCTAHLEKETCVDVKLSSQQPNHVPIDLKSNLKENQTCKYILHPISVGQPVGSLQQGSFV